MFSFGVDRWRASLGQEGLGKNSRVSSLSAVPDGGGSPRVDSLDIFATDRIGASLGFSSNAMIGDSCAILEIYYRINHIIIDSFKVI